MACTHGRAPFRSRRMVCAYQPRFAFVIVSGQELSPTHASLRSSTAIIITSSDSLVEGSRTPNQLLDVRPNSIAISELSCVRTELVPLLIIPSLAHHPVQPDRQSACHCDLCRLASTKHHSMSILT